MHKLLQYPSNEQMVERQGIGLTDEALVHTGPVPPDHPAHAGVDQAVLVAAAVD